MFLVQKSLAPDEFTAILYPTIVMLALLHIGPVLTPGEGGLTYYGVIAYVVILTAIYSLFLWTQ